MLVRKCRNCRKDLRPVVLTPDVRIRGDRGFRLMHVSKEDKAGCVKLAEQRAASRRYNKDTYWKPWRTA